MSDLSTAIADIIANERQEATERAENEALASNVTTGSRDGARATTEPHKSRYSRTINGGLADVYDVLVAFGVTNPATAHAVKKLLMPGQRGAKNAIQDLAEARDSIDRAIQLEARA